MKNEVWIIGAGGIGCALGYSLLEQGISVNFVERNPSKVESGRKQGVRIDQARALPAEFMFPEAVSPPANALVLLCTKCYDNNHALENLLSPIRLIPIQNGFDASLSAYNHTFEAVASFVSECAGDRPWSRITRSGKLHIGSRGSRDHELPEFFLTALKRSSLFKLVEVERIEPFKYTKLMYNSAISPIAAVAGIDNGKLLSLPTARKLFFALLQENYHILANAGIELGKIGPFHPRTVNRILKRKWLSGLLASAFEPSLRGSYCSMAGEIQKGRTEIDNYNGYLIQLAKRSGTECPINETIYSLVQIMTRDRQAPNMDRLEVLRV